jgi:hypothetical protein
MVRHWLQEAGPGWRWRLAINGLGCVLTGIVAVVVTVATIVGLVVLGGRIYTRAILHTGAAMKLSDAWRGTSLAAPLVADAESVPRRKTKFAAVSHGASSRHAWSRK